MADDANASSSTPLPVTGNTEPLQPQYVAAEPADTPMTDATPVPGATPHLQQQSQPQPQPPTPTPAPNSATATPMAPRTSTPAQSAAATQTPMPAKAAPHGAPARRYLNEKVTVSLLEGMKRLAAEQPEDPLRVLGEFLLQKSKELEAS